jgi:hypothetical protein
MVYLEKVPEEAIYTWDKQYLAEQIIDEFFLNIEEYILSLYEYYFPSNFEIKFRELAHSGKITKDKLTYLVLNDEKEYVLAGILCTQTEFKNWNYTFFRDLSCLEKLFYSK